MVVVVTCIWQLFLSVPESAAQFPQGQGLEEVTNLPAFSRAGESALVSIQ